MSFYLQLALRGNSTYRSIEKREVSVIDILGPTTKANHNQRPSTTA